jgi:CxxC motif-containing protein
MKKTYTCIICPNGCEIEVEFEAKDITSIIGATCKRGEEYVGQELIHPMRNIASSVLVTGGELPLASVKLSNRIPKTEIFAVMEEIKKVKISAPVKIGQVILKNVLGLGSDVVATKNVSRI